MVIPLPTDFTGGWSMERITGAASSPLANACSMTPHLPNCDLRNETGVFARSPMVNTPYLSSFACVARPTYSRSLAGSGQTTFL